MYGYQAAEGDSEILFLTDKLLRLKLFALVSPCLLLGISMLILVLFAQYFVNSSLSPVLLFRWRVKSVADVLKGIRRHGFTQSRWDALCRYWGAVSSWTVWACSDFGTLGSLDTS